MKCIITCYMYIVWCAPCIFVFGRKKHRALLTTCERTTAPGGCVLVFYTHHLPHLAHRDMEFFKMAGEMRWECEKVLTERFPVGVWVVRAGIFRNSLNKNILIFIAVVVVVAGYSAYVPGGRGRRGGAVNGTWVEAHAKNCTLIWRN